MPPTTSAGTFNFNDKVLVLTGANGGISRAITRHFLDLGARVVLTDIRDEEMREFASSLDPSGKRLLCVHQDARNPDDARGLRDSCRKHYDEIDFVVTAAGIYHEHGIEDMTDGQWKESLEVNLFGVFYTCRQLMPLIRDGGAIVNIASMAGHRGSYRHHAHYAAAKGGVLALTRSLAQEIAPRIRANAVSPGLIDTTMVESLVQSRGETLIDATPMKRLGTPAEIAAVVAFLCSDWAGYITGETIHVNGGLYIAS